MIFTLIFEQWKVNYEIFYALFYHVLKFSKQLKDCIFCKTI